MLKAVKTVAPTEASVLLLGETGTGKAGRPRDPRAERTSPAHVRARQCRSDRQADRKRIVRPREGAFTGAVASRPGRLGSPTAARCSSTRSATWRSSSVQAAARAAGTGVRAARQHPHPPRQHSSDRGHQPKPRRDGRGRHLPARSLLPPQRLSHPAAAASRTDARHPGAGALLRGTLRAAHAPAAAADSARGNRRAVPLAMAGQHSRAGERHPAGDDPQRRPGAEGLVPGSPGECREGAARADADAAGSDAGADRPGLARLGQCRGRTGGRRRPARPQTHHAAIDHAAAGYSASAH